MNDTDRQETEIPSGSPRDILCSKPVRAVLAFLAFAIVLDGLPRMKRWHLFGIEPIEGQPAQLPKSEPASQLSIGEASLSEESKTSDDRRAESDVSRAQSAARGPIARAEVNNAPLINVDTKAPPIPIEDPSGRALAPFFSRLSATMEKRPGAITRIVHFGDSVVASDYVSGTLRRRFQEQFGDSGHGFTLLANAWPAYFHEGVTRFATSGWLISRVVGPLADDGWHGLGGVSFKAPPHLLARIGTAKKGEFGRNVSRFVLMYVESPEGGVANIKLDGVAQPALDTNGPNKQFRTSTYSAPDGEHELEIQTVKGTSRFFGIVLERDQPGVVLDAIGIQGARIRFLDKQDDAHYREQLLWRDPALVIYQFGANESADGYAYSMADYHQTMKAVVEQQRAALPNASCLILGAMDRATRKGDEIRSLTIIPLLVEQQRKVAFEVGCAFFDTFRAMGGPGSMPNWYRRDLGQSDLTHPTAVGAEVIGNWIYRALMQAGKGPAVPVVQ